MAGTEWIFDPRPPSGALQGGAAWAHTVPSRLKTFVRESLQNCRDQRLEDEGIQVTFSLRSLHGEHLDRFLEAMEWPSLRPHIEAAAQAGGPLGITLRKTLEQLAAGSLRILSVEDHPGRGLAGGEDEPHRNFNALCRNVLDSRDDRPGRGGSHGLGKAVFWRMSGLSTVLFASRLAEADPHQGFRAFGRCELSGHETDDGSWRGPGWFGMPDRQPRGDRAVSLWDAAARDVVAPLYLGRREYPGPGTSVLVVGFVEPTEEEDRDPVEIMEDMLEHAADWFWPAMAMEDPPTLSVTGRVYENDRCVFERDAGPGERHRCFLRAARGSPDADRLLESGALAERSLTFNIPARRGADGRPAGSRTPADITLRLLRAAPEGGGQHPPANSVALVRGSGMVVEYYSLPRLDQLDPPLWGVLLAGRARGSEATDDALDQFLKAAEPITHEQWEATERVQQNYGRGGRTELSRLRQNIRQLAHELCTYPGERSGTGPRALARLFPLAGGGSVPGKHPFSVDDLSARLDPSSGVWRFQGAVTRSDNASAWEVSIRLWLDVETGRGEPCELQEVRAETSGVETQLLDDHQAVIRLPASVRRLRFQGQTVPGPQGHTGDFMSRTRARLEVVPAAVRGA